MKMKPNVYERRICQKQQRNYPEAVQTLIQQSKQKRIIYKAQQM